MARKKSAIPPNAVHPGEILREEFMAPLGLTAYRLAKELRVGVPRINELIRERRAMTADTALRLARYFVGTTAQYWMTLQANFEIDVANANAKRKQLEKIKPRTTAAA
jgi:addiction module HigA family antidote